MELLLGDVRIETAVDRSTMGIFRLGRGGSQSRREEEDRVGAE